MPEYRLLLVEDDANQRKTLAGFLRKRGYRVAEAGSVEEAQRTARLSPPHLLITDLRLGGPTGIELLRDLKPLFPEMEALVLTAYGTISDAVEAMRAGAYDFVTKPIDLDRLELLVAKALERVALRDENRRLRQASKEEAFATLVGDSEAMRRVREMGARVAQSRVPVLVLGESGTGKEVLARAIHRASPRAEKPFVAVNCAALPESLIESELFGHQKGAFTGATADRPGRFELAEGGTLFLDEVGDIPLPLQVKLLRVLQSNTFERLGGTKTIQVDVRLIAATHRNLEERIREGLFRQDLFYRLNVVAIPIPPLRERPEDIPLLVDHLLRKHRDLAGTPVDGVEPEVMERLRRFPFPGNTRELENWIERALVLATGSRLSRADFPPQLFDEPATGEAWDPAAPLAGGLDEQVAELERRLIREALEKSRGNQSAAARELGITERAIRYKIKKYDIR
jgi:two-component system NtrC family response regulator